MFILLPFISLFAYYILWIKLGPFYCVSILILTVIITIILVLMVECASKNIYNEGKFNDERIRLITDSIIGIKTIKCFNREDRYE